MSKKDIQRFINPINVDNARIISNELDAAISNSEELNRLLIDIESKARYLNASNESTKEKILRCQEVLNEL